MFSRSRMLWVVALVLVSSACSSTGGPAPRGPGDDELSSTYGYGPRDDPAVEYQPDVVRVGGGAQAIRSASADGLIWTLDPTAPGVDQLAVGKVAFVTSRPSGASHGARRRPRGSRSRSHPSS